MARQFFNLAEVMGQVDQSRVRDQQIKANEFAMQNQQRQYERQARQDADLESQRNIYRGAIEPVEGGGARLNEKKLIEDMLRDNPEIGLKLQQQFQDRDINAGKLQRDNQMGELELKTKKASFYRDALATATPETYPSIIQQAQQDGMAFATNAPLQFDPAFIKQNVMTADKFLESTKIKAPTTRTVRMGNDTVTQQFNDQTGQFEEVGRGSAFAPDKFMSTNGEQQYSTKPLPTASLKIQNEALEKLSIAGNTNVQLDKVLGQINDGKLKLGLVSNLVGQARNFTGNSSESSRNLSSFKSTLEKLRNDSLRLNKGVQTDGDAQRAWNELFENINDEGVVKQRLEEIKQINTRATELQKMEVENIRSNYNAAPIDFSRYEAKSNVGNGNILPKDAAMPTKPKVGVIDGGYVFLGGDPANPKSWKKAK